MSVEMAQLTFNCLRNSANGSCSDYSERSTMTTKASKTRSEVCTDLGSGQNLSIACVYSPESNMLH